jgi:hypothetical protein
MLDALQAGDGAELRLLLEQHLRNKRDAVLEQWREVAPEAIRQRPATPREGEARVRAGGARSAAPAGAVAGSPASLAEPAGPLSRQGPGTSA